MAQPQPVDTFAQSPLPPIAPAPRSNGAKKWIIIGAIVAAVLLIAGIVITVLIISFSVSRQDFRASLDEAQKVRSAYSSLRSSSSVSAYSTETQRQNTINTLKKDRSELNAAINGLADDKAIKLDNGARERYDALIQKKKAFDNAFDAVIEAYEEVYPALITYTEGNQSGSPEARLNTVSAARGQLEKLEIKDTNNKQLVDKLVANFKTQEQLLPRVIAGRQDYRVYDSAAVTAYYAAGNEASDIVRDWSSNFTKQADDSEINKEINALGQYLSEKAS